MPWKDNNDDSGKGSKGGSDSGGKRSSPWGSNSGSSGSSGGGDGDQSGTPPRNPWGNQPGPREPDGRKSNTPDFDEFIRRSQERLRGLGGGGNNGGGRSAPGGPPNLPWGLILGGVALLAIIATSAYRVDAGERGVVSRFGKYSSTAGPGFHLKLPLPIDTVTKVKFEDIRTDLIGTVDGDNENLMITGDGNVISIAYAVRWRIRNAEDFLFHVADPNQTVRDATESAMREVVGRSTLNNAIGPERAAIAEDVRVRVQEILDSYQTGVLVQGIDINRADPPAAVDEAFKDVSAAQQDAQQFLNQARAYAQQIAAQAAGATAAFDKVHEEYRLAPQVTRKRMYMETMEQVLSKVDKTVIEAPGVQTYMPLPELQRHARQAREGGQP